MNSDAPSSSNPHDTIRLEDSDIATSPLSSIPPTAYQEDHARITPINDAAKRAFREIALIVKSDPRWNSHAQRFIHIEEAETPDAESKTGSSTEGSVALDEAQTILSGYYRLNLAILPAKFVNGWIIGTGRNRPTQANVDILISIHGRRDNVRTRHARVLYHRESRAPMVGALPNKAIFLNGQEIGEQAQVLSQSQGIVIGNLAYRLEFLSVDKARYVEALDMIVGRTRSLSHGNHSSFDPTPSSNHFELRGYQFQTPQAAGAYGVVSACIKISTGDLFAVKRVQRTVKYFALVSTEVMMMKLLDKHPHVCRLVETFYSDGDRVSMGSSSINDVYMILDPWAPQSIKDFAASQPSSELLTLAYHQGAQGIRHLHHCDIIHRDIKPANLLLATFSPLRLVVADFGHATAAAPDTESLTDKRRRDLQNHMKGTISYHPPEITALKSGTDMTGYWSKASDVFAYAVVGLELFHGRLPRSRSGHCIDKTVHQHILDILRSASAIDELLTSMVQWKASERPTVDQILLKSVWTASETSISTTKRKRRHDLWP